MTTVTIPVTAHRGRDSWLLTFACPWCRRTHVHGAGSIDQPPADGHRLSHCHHPAAPSGYVLRIQADQERDRSPLSPDHPKMLAFDRPPERRVPDGDEAA